MAAHPKSKAPSGASLDRQRVRWRAERTIGAVTELLDAIEQDRLHLVYQPIVDLVSLRVVDAEALLRWVRPGGDAVPPEHIVDFAEACGLSNHLAGWVVRTAIRDAGIWRRSGRDIGLAINVSPQVASDPKRVDYLLEILTENRFDAQCLTVEITESTVMMDPLGVRATLERLRQERVQVSIDDFGTGDSSLSRLQDLPFTQLKIDKSFVARAMDHQTSSRLTNFASMLGRALGLTVVAEGVEDEPTFEFLRRCRIDRAQGYLFSRPVTPQALIAAVDEIEQRLCGTVPSSRLPDSRHDQVIEAIENRRATSAEMPLIKVEPRGRC